MSKFLHRRSLPRTAAVIGTLVSVTGVLSLVMTPNLAGAATQTRLLEATGTRTTAPAQDFACSISRATGAPSTKLISTLSSGGSSDMTSKIQAAINAASASGGGLVKMKTGTFTIDGHLVDKTNVRLMGSGATTVLKAGPSFLRTSGPNGGYPIITTNGASNVTIGDLTADQSSNTLTGAGNSRLSGYLIDLRNSTNAVVTHIATNNPLTYSIAAVGSNHFCIEYSTVQVTTSGYDQLDGIHVTNSSYGDVIDNTVNPRMDNNTAGDDAIAVQTFSGASAHNLRIAGNTATGGYNGADVQLAESSSSDSEYNIFLIANTFYNGVEGIHTGCYSMCGTFKDIVIGGTSGHANYISNNDAGINPYQPGDALNLTGAISGSTVSYNHVCDNGSNALTVPAGNSVVDNVAC
jgi:hypothetical protein